MTTPDQIQILYFRRSYNGQVIQLVALQEGLSLPLPVSEALHTRGPALTGCLGPKRRRCEPYAQPPLPGSPPSLCSLRGQPNAPSWAQH